MSTLHKAKDNECCLINREDLITFFAASLLPFSRFLRVVEPPVATRDGLAIVAEASAAETNEDDEMLPKAAVCDAGTDAELPETLLSLTLSAESPLASLSLCINEYQQKESINSVTM